MGGFCTIELVGLVPKKQVPQRSEEPQDVTMAKHVERKVEPLTHAACRTVQR